MDLQKRRQELEQELTKVNQQIQQVENRITFLRNSYQQMVGAITLIDEQLKSKGDEKESQNSKE
jgi:hypothetical protein